MLCSASSRLPTSWLLLSFLRLFFLFHGRCASAASDPSEVSLLLAIKNTIRDDFNRLSNWVGDDPCGSNTSNIQWTGVYCTSPQNGVQYVEELRLLRMNLTGSLSPALGNLTQLRILNFMWNGLTGSIPSEIGNLSKLELLLLNGNALTGVLPQELGYLSKLNRLQIDSNDVSGPVPSSFQYLVSVRHIHLNNNSLNGSIPKEMGNLPKLLHLLLDSNDFNGELPPELSNISTLVILQLDNNHFSGSIPLSYSTMNLTKLSLRNCNLTGSIPDFSSQNYFSYLDLSHNHLDGPLPALKTESGFITTIDLSFNELDGNLSSNYFRLLNLERLLLQNNSLDGTVEEYSLTHNPFSNQNSTLILDLRNNNFTGLVPGATSLSVSNITTRLSGNPVCVNDSTARRYCQDVTETPSVDTSPVTAAPASGASCSQQYTCDTLRGQELLVVAGICRCVYPLLVGYRLKSPSFSDFHPHENGFYVWISSGLKLETYQVLVSEYNWEVGPRLRMKLKLFPNTTEFELAEVDYLYSVLSNWSMPPNDTYGPYELLSFTIGYPYNESLSQSTSTKTLSNGAVAGIVIGITTCAAVVVVVIIFVVIRSRHAKTAKRSRRHGRTADKVKISGVRVFTFDEMIDATNSFDGSSEIGKGGYGKVYKGRLRDGTIVAIKRAQEDSMQGSKEFYTEIELLSRVHHRNLVSLIGYCDEQEEQMLVYEYMPNGTLFDHLHGDAAARPLDFESRLQIAQDSAKGIQYLHTEANPPIYHRDIKATNILLDDKMTAKVADFGLSKLAPELDLNRKSPHGGYISTVVKGTPGYVDPEYFLTQQLSDKSDVYSFGVVLMELITGMQPIYDGKNLVREVSMAFEKEKGLVMVDPRMGAYPSECMRHLIRLAIGCTKEETANRPSMTEVVRELSDILRWAEGEPRDAVAWEELVQKERRDMVLESGATTEATGSAVFRDPIVEVYPR